MELLGLLAVLLFLYLLIAPAVAWARSSGARAMAEAQERANQVQAREIRELKAQVKELRDQQQQLLKRIESLGQAPAGVAEPVQPAQPAGIAAPARFRAAAPRPPERSASADVSFDPAEFGIPELPPAKPSSAPIDQPVVAPPIMAPQPPPAAPVPAAIAGKPVAAAKPPLHSSWDLEPVERSEEPADEPVAAARWTEAPAAAAASAATEPVAKPAREPVWTPKPPVDRRRPRAANVRRANSRPALPAGCRRPKAGCSAAIWSPRSA
ncbi:MAG: hypothetical protein IPO66_23760 [Rhodanobacteraceae bacterium]|nr:hypothetical protein [Rhodanobacteraceae bacterium]